MQMKICFSLFIFLLFFSERPQGSPCGLLAFPARRFVVLLKKAGAVLVRLLYYFENNAFFLFIGIIVCYTVFVISGFAGIFPEARRKQGGMIMIIHHPRTAAEAFALRNEKPDSRVYLAGGTDDLRLGSEAAGKELIDINGLGFDTIEKKDGRLVIGARVTLRQLAENGLVPAFLRDAAKFCASFIKRNSATVGGNLALRRDDSYLAAAFCAADAKLEVITPEGEKEVEVLKYLNCGCPCLIKSISVDAGRTGSVKRFGNTSQSHAALIAAQSEGLYALSVHGSGTVCGRSPEVYAELNYVDDLTGGAEYKKYLAKTVFEQGR